MQKARIIGSWVFVSVFAVILAMTPPALSAETVGGSFEQFVPWGSLVHAGTLPEGSRDASIHLSSDRDLDIQVYDDSYPVVGYPNGLINSADEITGEYAGVEIRYSGYNGDGTGPGNEFVIMEGTLDRDLDIYVYGYQSGNAFLEYEATVLDPAEDGQMTQLGELPEEALARSVTVLEDTAWVAADNNVYRLSLDGANEWRLVEEFPAPVSDVLVHPEQPEVIIASLGHTEELSTRPIHRSIDGGESWQTVEGDFGLGAGYWANVHELHFEPGSGWLLASGQGDSIAYSDDDGATWAWLHGSADSFGYPCVLGSIEVHPGEIYQGCEAGAFDVVDVYRVNLPDGERDAVIEWPEIDNRRPNVISSFESVTDEVFVGVEGGLLYVDAEDDWNWIYKHDGDGGEPGDELRYTYVNTVWVNPVDSDHLVFGGTSQVAGSQPELYETRDGGERVERIDWPDTLPRGEENYINGGAVTGEDGENFVFLLTTDKADGRGESEEARSWLILYEG